MDLSGPLPLEHEALSDEEYDVLENFLKRLRFPVPPRIFDAWCAASVTVPIELAILRKGDSEVFLIHRKDKFYDGNHMPGTVLLPGQQCADRLQALRQGEVSNAGLTVTNPQFVTAVETLMGPDHEGKNPRGQEMAVLFVCRVVDDNAEPTKGAFYPLGELPPDTLVHHIRLVEKVKSFLRK
jgi:hypothetical protein